MVLLMLVAVSGTGKSSIARRLLEKNPRLRLSVSHTTRPPRHGEIHGKHYIFVSRDEFETVRVNGGFAEWAEYVGNRYGTARSTIELAKSDGYDLIFDIEVQGAEQLKSAYPMARSIFILPPSWAGLRARLVGRGTETEASVERRLARGRAELNFASGFDHLVVNDNLDHCVEQIERIYQGTYEPSTAADVKLQELLAYKGDA